MDDIVANVDEVPGHTSRPRARPLGASGHLPPQARPSACARRRPRGLPARRTAGLRSGQPRALSKQAGVPNHRVRPDGPAWYPIVARALLHALPPR
jgi:hypothetical protein